MSRNYLTREVKDSYNEIYSSLKEEIKKNIRKLKDIPCSSASRTNIVDMIILPKLIRTFSTIPIKIPRAFFIKLRIPKLTRNQKRLRNTKAILDDKRQAGGITIPDFKLYYKAAVIKSGTVLA